MTPVEVWAQLALAVTWQMAALAVLALICERALRLRQPRVRHALWWFALMAPLLLAPTRLWLAQIQANVMVPTPMSVAAPLGLTSQEWRESLPQAGAAASEGRSISASALRPDLATALAALWAIGCIALALRLVVGHWRVRRMLAAGEPVAEPHVLESLAELCRLARLRRRVELRTSTALSSAVLYGVTRPVIVAPRQWLAELGPEQLRALLAHEVAHVRRRDVLAALAQRVAGAILFFHPGAWMASRRIALAREELCDEWALTQSATRTSYARTLAMAAERALTRPALATVGLAESRFTLLQRVEAIMKGDRRGRTSRLALIALAVVAVIAASTFAAVQLRGQSTEGGGGGGPVAVGGGGGGGGWHDSGQPPSSDGSTASAEAAPGEEIRTPYKISTGEALKPGFTPLVSLTIADIDPKQLRHYTVDKHVTDYPDREDLSLPELSYATFMRAAARGDQGIWRRLSTASDPRLPPVDAPPEKVSPSDVKLYLGRKIVEVYVYQGRRAEVIGAVLREDGTLDGYDIRSLELRDGRWLNRGSDGGRTFEGVRNRVAYLFLYEERKPSREQLARDTALRYPLSFTMKAEEVFRDLQAVDYGTYLNSSDLNKWQEFPVDYMPSADRQTWVEWVCTTFSRNPIVHVTLGAAFRHRGGNPAVPYQLTLEDGRVLSGDLQFELLIVGKESAYFCPRRGLDWHTPKKDTQ